MNAKVNRSDLIVLGTYLVISICLLVIDYVKDGAGLLEYVLDIPALIFMITATVYVFITKLLPMVVKDKKYLTFAILGSMILILFSSIQYFIGHLSAYQSWPNINNIFTFSVKRLELGADTTAFPLALILFKKYYEGQTEYLKIQQRNKENELKLLRTQLDPHFLFNNLNTLDAIIGTQPQKAKEYVNRLATTYRYLIQTKDSEIMELEKELDFVESYIFLIETRFGTDYAFRIIENTRVKDKFIPTGALQALIENVVKHNKAQKGEIIETKIEIRDEVIIVENSKSSRILNLSSSKTGLENLNVRYKWLSDKEVIINNSDKSFKVIIPLMELNKTS